MPQREGLLNALRLFPPPLSDLLRSCAAAVPGRIWEIRVYTGKAVVFSTDGGALFCRTGGGVSSYPAPDRLRPDGAQVFALVNAAADSALFLRERELKNAYLTNNGCRVAICGFSPEGKLLGREITSVNLRVPCTDIPRTADKTLLPLLRDSGGLLIAGPPASGKTTVLKRCAMLLAGEPLGWRRVAVIDERDEFSGTLSSDDGLITADILRGTDKAQGIQTALRLFSPEYILCDEIGGEAETAGMLEGLNSGVRFVASIHAADLAQLRRRRQFAALQRAGVFDRAAFLSANQKGRIEKVVALDGPL